MAEGHRLRLRQKFAENGINALTNEEVMELLLTCCIPRKDTYDTAVMLLQRYGSVKKAMQAVPEELLNVPGFGENSAVMFSFLSQLLTKYDLNRETDRYLKTTSDKGYFLVNKYGRSENELLIALYFGKGEKLLSESVVKQGNHLTVGVDVELIAREYKSCKAEHVVIAHNHPSGLALPSFVDIETTRCLRKKLSEMKIVLSDHIVFEDNDFISFKDSNL